MHSHQEQIEWRMTVGPSPHMMQNYELDNSKRHFFQRRMLPQYKNQNLITDGSFPIQIFPEIDMHRSRVNEEVRTNQYRKHSGSRLSSSFNFSTSDHSVEHILGQVSHNGWEHLTPPATDSSSRSTLFSCSSAPPFYTDYSYCTSPVPSEDFDRPYSSYGSSDFYGKASSYDDRLGIMKGCYTKDNGGVIYGQENIYTAETVHNLVKNRRDGTKKRTVSNKVFVGGISHTMNREIINAFFARFGTVFVDWPVKGPRTNGRGKPLPMSSYSYLFLVYFDEQSVLKLMEACHNPIDNEYFVNVPGCRDSLIQIRPWFIKNAFYIANKAFDRPLVDIHRTVFVGGLPRIVTALEIAKMFTEFGRVLLVTIDIDQDYGYPKGAARVTFERDRAFNHALERKYLKFENIDSSKTTIEIKPYVMEDIGCDQCGGLWFNPFLEIFDQLKGHSKQINYIPKIKPRTFLIPEKARSFDMWSCNHPFSMSHLRPEGRIMRILPHQSSKINQSGTQPFEVEDEFATKKPTDADVDKTDVLEGSHKLLDITKAFNLDKIQYFLVEETDYVLGPDLWSFFVTMPPSEQCIDQVRVGLENQVEAYLRLKRGSVYSNKSSYCKDKPCRQYYCPSCSNKIHAGPNQHILLPAGKPERRPRKDKNMYLVKQI